MISFDFLDKVLGTLSPQHFMCDFPRKMFFMFYLLTKYHCVIPLLLEVLDNIFIAIDC